jgi:predicted Holliday junction resolvase-like endonuclease
MVITSFVLGMLTVIGIALVILVVLGIVKIYKQDDQIRSLNRDIEHAMHNADLWVKTLEETTSRNFDEIRREYSSYVDSRIDKLQTKAKREVLKG